MKQQMYKVWMISLALGPAFLGLGWPSHATAACEPDDLLCTGVWVESNAIDCSSSVGLVCAEWETEDHLNDEPVHPPCCVEVQDLGGSNPDACVVDEQGRDDEGEF